MGTITTNTLCSLKTTAWVAVNEIYVQEPGLLFIKRTDRKKATLVDSHF